jgi:class 3 adenylate cyclase
VLLLEIGVHLDLMWTDPHWLEASARLAERCRVLSFQQMGLGLSDTIERVPTLEEQVSDVTAVMDAEGVSSATLFGVFTTAMPVVLFAAQAPERVDALVLFSPLAQGPRNEGFDGSAGLSMEDAEAILAAYDDVFELWGQGRAFAAWNRVIAPRNRHIAAMLERSSGTPAVAAAVYEAAFTGDVRDVLPLVQAPTLVLRHPEFIVPASVARLVAELIPRATFRELPPSHPAMSVGESVAPVFDHVLEVATGHARNAHDDRQLASILFTDVAGSTELIVEHGDAHWRELLEHHESQIRGHVEDSGGRLVKMIGDGSMSIFPGPAAAIRAAQSICTDAPTLGIEVRAGVHAGECDRRPGGDISGLAVHIAARVGSAAAPGEVWVSRTVRDLVGGSGLELTRRGVHELKGVTERWELFSLAGENHAAAAISQEPSPMRSGDRLAVAVARHSPGVLRALNRLDNTRRRALRRRA